MKIGMPASDYATHYAPDCKRGLARCGEAAPVHLTHDEGEVTCGRCNRILEQGAEQMERRTPARPLTMEDGRVVRSVDERREGYSEDAGRMTGWVLITGEDGETTWGEYEVIE